MRYAETTRWLALGGLILANAAASPVHAQTATVPTVPGLQFAAAELDSEDAYRLALLKMKGHLSVARALLQMRAPGAAYYMQEPVQDIYEDARAEFERRNAPFTADTVQQLEHADAGDPATTMATIELAVTALDGSFAQTGAMDAESALAISEALLREAVAKYAEAVTDNEVVDLRKYQKGRGFVTVAEALVRYSSGLKRRPNHGELLKVVTLIRQAWPGIVPPSIVFDPASVAGRLDEAMAVMEAMR